MASAAELAVLLSLKGHGDVSRGLKDVGDSSDGLGTKLTNLGKTAALGLAAVGVAAGAMAVSMVQEAMAAERVMAQTEAVIRSTGSAAGLSATEISNMAEALSKVTPYEDDVIQSGQNMLLTFTNIGKDVFPKATEAMLNMSTALGTDLNSSAIMLGKALNDPIAGISAMGRAGIQFSEDQKSAIKAMVETGDIAGAQALILGELERQFGNSAKAAGETFAGKLTILKNQIGNVKEAIGLLIIRALTPLLPHIQRLVEWMGDKLPGYVERLARMLSGPFSYAFTLVRDAVLTFVAALQGNWTDGENIRPLHRVMGNLGILITETILPAIRAIAGFVKDHLIPIFMAWVDWVRNVITAFNEGGLMGALGALLGGFVDFQKTLYGKLLELGQMFVEWITPFIPPMLEKLADLLSAAGQWIMDTGAPLLMEQLAAWGNAFVAWVTPYIDVLLEKLTELVNAARDWIIGDGLDMLVENIKAWAAAFVDWVQPQGAVLLAKVEELLAQLGDWLVGDGLTTLMTKIGEWTAAFVAWVGPVWLELEKALLSLLYALGEWIVTTAYPAIVTKLAEWSAAFAAWVLMEAWPKLLNEFGTLMGNIVTWMAETALPAIKVKLTEWATAFLEWIVTEVTPYIASKADDIMTALGGWMTDTALPAIKAKLVEWATAFLGWIGSDVLPYLPGKLAEILTTISGWVVESIATVLGYGAQIGQAIVDGMTQAIMNAAQELKDAAIGVVQGAIDAVKEKFGISSPSQVTHDEIGVPIGAGIAGGIIASLPMIQQAMGEVVDMVMTAGAGIASLPTSPGVGWWDGNTSPPPTVIGDSVAIGNPLDSLHKNTLGNGQQNSSQYGGKSGGPVNVAVYLDSEPIAAAVSRRIMPAPSIVGV